MRCYFCHRIMDAYEVFPSSSFPEVEIGDCISCSTDNVIAKTVSDDIKIITAHLYVQLKGISYQCIFNVKEHYFAIKCLTYPLDSESIIYYSTDIPSQITPDNILVKLPLYLTFL